MMFNFIDMTVPLPRHGYIPPAGIRLFCEFTYFICHILKGSKCRILGFGDDMHQVVLGLGPVRAREVLKMFATFMASYDW